MKTKFPFWVQLALFTLILLTIAILSFSIHGYQTSKKAYLKSFENRTNSIANIIGVNYAREFLHQNAFSRGGSGKNVLNLMEKENDISYVIFKTPSGRQIDYFVKPNTDIKNVISVERKITMETIREDYDEEKRTIGSIVVAYENHIPKLMTATKKSVLIFGIILLFTGLFSSGLVSYFFTRPLYKVVEGMEKLENGDTNVKVPENRKDEIGHLASTFNRMAEGLRVKQELLHYVSASTWKETHNRIKYNEKQVIARKKELTILFSDMRSFTKMSEKLEATEVVELLNEYFEEMTSIIMKNGGYIDKFIGDALMAIFEGSPDFSSQAAVTAAFEMQKAVDKKLYHNRNISIRIGINFGDVILGDIGSSKSRRDYTCIGSVVNRAQYMESICNPGEIVVGELTYKLLKEDVKTVKETVTLKGTSEPIDIYRISRK
ncbi:adenylate/guanylate cyclase domain-containing protein [Elusimicrobiota bacterium]